MKEKMAKDNIIDRLLDEDDCCNVTLYAEDGSEVEMAQIALIAAGGAPYALLAPVELLEKGQTDCLLAFAVREDGVFEVTDDDLLSEIFEEYDRLYGEGR